MFKFEGVGNGVGDETVGENDSMGATNSYLLWDDKVGDDWVRGGMIRNVARIRW